MKRLNAFILPVFFFSFAALPFSCISAGKDGGVFKSTNLGESWQQKTVISQKKNISRSNILTISFDPRNSKIVYLGTRGEGIYKSMDGGDIWYPLEDSSNALDKLANVYDIAIDPRDNNNVYAGVYQLRMGRLLRSQNAGKNWEEVYRVSREEYAVFAVEIDSFDPSVVYMGTAEGGFLKSVDSGKSWQTIKWFDDVITDIKVNPYDRKTVYISTYNDGIYKTNDQGQTWQSLEAVKSFKEKDSMEVLVMDKHNPDTLYSGSQLGLLKTTDGGRTWARVNIIIPPQSVPITAVAIDPNNSSYLYYAAGDIVYRSQDGGQTWTEHPILSERYVKAIAIDPSNSNIVYAGMHKND